MAFMIPEYVKGTFWEVTDEGGEGWLVPGDLVGDDPEAVDFEPFIPLGGVAEYEKVTGWFARLSAPGYMDATDWDGPFETKEEAEKHIEDTWEVNAETGEPLYKKVSTKKLKTKLLQ